MGLFRPGPTLQSEEEKQRLLSENKAARPRIPLLLIAFLGALVLVLGLVHTLLSPPLPSSKAPVAPYRNAGYQGGAVSIHVSTVGSKQTTAQQAPQLLALSPVLVAQHTAMPTPAPTPAPAPAPAPAAALSVHASPPATPTPTTDAGAPALAPAPAPAAATQPGLVLQTGMVAAVPVATPAGRAGKGGGAAHTRTRPARRFSS